MKKTIFAIVLYLFSFTCFSQDDIRLNKIEPPFWMDGFHDPELLLLVYGNNISKTDVSLSGEGMRLEKVITTGDSNYLLLHIVFTAPPTAGNYPIAFSYNKKFLTEYLFEIRPGPAPVVRKGFAEIVTVSPSITDLYRTDDARQQDFLADTLHSKNKELVFQSGLKIGNGHPWVSNPPSPGWITTNKTSRTSEIRIKRNPYTDRYMAQNCLWWTAVLQPDVVCLNGEGEDDPSYFEMIKSVLGKEFPDLPVINCIR